MSARIPASTVAARSPTTRIRRRSNRSAITPPGNESNSSGAYSRAYTTAVFRADPVSSNTISGSARR